MACRTSDPSDAPEGRGESASQPDSSRGSRKINQRSSRARSTFLSREGIEVGGDGPQLGIIEISSAHFRHRDLELYRIGNAGSHEGSYGIDIGRDVNPG